MEKVTIKEVAKAAGVSFTTVSRALSGSPGVGETTRARIRRICEEMGYTPNAIARSMVQRRTNTIGLIVSSINNPFMSEVTESIENRLREHGYHMTVCNSSGDVELERKAYELLLERQADGILLIPVGTESYATLKPLLGRAPTIFISENLKDHPVNYVSVDNYRGGKLGTKYLISLGHKRILYLGCRRGSAAHLLRADGYRDACLKRGLEPDYLDNEAGSSYESGYRLAQQYFAGGQRHTAIFCAADSIAIGVMRAADELGVRIPEDISVLGFDNIFLSDLPRISLSTVEQPKPRIAASAVDMLLEQIETEEDGTSYRVIAPRLIERCTCAPVAEEA